MVSKTSVSEISAAELSWVEYESINQVLVLAQSSRKSAVVMLVMLLSMLYPLVETPIWWIWVVLHVFVIATRMLHLEHVKKLAEKNYDYRKSAWVVGFITFSWGSTAYPILSSEHSKITILVLNLILIYGMVCTVNFARHTRIFKVFFNCYGAGLIGAAICSIIFKIENQSLGHSLTMLTSLLLFLFILNKVGKEINRSHIETLHYQYRNSLLIESLTTEKQTALDAVALKNRFMASATHDMRQPILALDLYMDMLVNIVNTPDEMLKLAPKITSATKSVITLFDAMFDLARMSMNQLVPMKTTFILKDMFEVLEQQYQPIAKDKNLQFRVQYKNTDIALFDDSILLRRVISNLLSNAIKYTETGGILLVCRTFDKTGLRIEVWDTGVGISLDMQKAVFSEFYKNPENLGTSDGFGLGLAIVAQSCALLGHRLTLKSNRGHGTKVAISLSKEVLQPLSIKGS